METKRVGIKEFHKIFIVASIALSFMFSFWGYGQYTELKSGGYLTTAILAACVGLGLLIYLISVVRKLKGIS